MFKIEKGIPVPEVDRNNAGRPMLYPFPRMEVGDSVLIDTPTDIMRDKHHYLRSKAAAAANKYGARSGKKFASRREGEFFRIWRIA